MRRAISGSVIALVAALGNVACGAGPAARVERSLVPDSAATAASSAGPADYADWVARQGFGGGSGLDGLAKAPRYLRDHLGDPGFDLVHWAQIADELVRWLEEHQPADCWADYHAALRQPVTMIRDDLAELQWLAEEGTVLPEARIAALEASISAARAIPTPAC